MNKITMLLVIVLIGVSVMASVVYHNSKETVTITVTGKERIAQGSGESLTHKWIVFTQNEVFENTDTGVFLKFNSSDIQNQLEIGKECTVDVAGWRVTYMSTYRNIIKVHRCREAI